MSPRHYQLTLLDFFSDEQELKEMINELSPQETDQQADRATWTRRRDRTAEEWSTYRHVIMNETLDIQGESPPETCCIKDCSRQAVIR